MQRTEEKEMHVLPKIFARGIEGDVETTCQLKEDSVFCVPHYNETFFTKIVMGIPNYKKSVCVLTTWPLDTGSEN